MWRPPRAHHCRVCKRCVRKMDHHCPWVNTCVGEWNQKFFILFLFYTLFCSLLACAVIAMYWKTVWESGSNFGVIFLAPFSPYLRRNHFWKIVDNIDHTPHVVTLLIEASLFGLFTAMILYDQIYAIIDDEVGLISKLDLRLNF